MSLQQLTDVLIGRVAVEGDDLVLTRKDYEETLPEGMTMASVKQHDAQRALYRAAAVSALGFKGNEKLEAEPERKSINTRAEYGASSRVDNRITRQHTVGKGDKRKEVYGHSTVVISNGEEPELLEAIEAIQKQAMAAFGPK